MDIQNERRVAGRYRLLSRLGSGGMGTVWRALDEVLGREVAVKEVTFPRGLSDEDRTVLYERTRREARAAARLDHSSAVTVFDVVEQDEAPYLVMELVEAPTLGEVVRRNGPLSPERTAEVGLALLGALEAAHRQGIVHRDVKPSNVLMREDGRVVLTDFGIASTTGDSSLTHTGLLLGSPAYMAPERARGEATGPPADLWSLGATLFTAVEGRPPFEGDDALVTVSAVVTGEHAPYVAAGPLVPVLDGLLAKDPAQRLDATGARRLLQDVVDAGGSRTRVLAPPIVDMTQADSSTAVLNARQVREEIAGAEREPEPYDQRYDIYEPTPPPLARARASRPPAQRGNRGKRASRVLPAALVTVLATAGAGYALTRDDAPGAGVAGSATTPDTSASATAQAPPPTRTEDPEQERTSERTTAAPEASAEPTDGESPATANDETDLPEGWSTDTGGAGWQVALPPGYSKIRANEYRDDNGRRLRIDTGPGQPDAVADRESQARSFARRHPSYEEIRIEPVDYRGYGAADWEFTYEGQHVINRVFVVDGTGHSLFFQTTASDFADARADFDRIAENFTPAGD